MAKMTHQQEINSRGLASGWHAQELQAKAARTGQTMAELFRESIRDSSAFNVPAACTRVSLVYVYYRFTDGSELKFPNRRRGTVAK